MIADRRRLAEQITLVRRAVDQLAEWIEYPERPFPGDAVAFGNLLRSVADLVLARDDMAADDVPDAGADGAR